MRQLAAIALLGWLLAGCGEQATPSEAHNHGDPIEVTASPDLVACDVRVRAEQAAAARIRGEYRLDSDAATVKAAAADPGATIDILGIPLTASERDEIRKQGFAIEVNGAIANWVNVGAPERFGGIWIDPPGSTHYVVAIVNGDAESLGLARCLEDADVRYVWANVSLADGRAKAERIAADMQAMRASGIEINGVGYQENEGTVVVGVSHPTPELERQFIERYGPPIRLDEAGPVINQ